VAAFQYSAKFVCGTPRAEELAPGRYFTAVNIHNPTSRDVSLRMKIALAGGEQPGPVSESVDLRLGSDEALEINCPDIRAHCGVDDDFVKGFVIIDSDIELDVVTVFTAAAIDGEVETLHTERLPPRRAKSGLPDLVPVPDPAGSFCKRDDEGKLIVTVKNQGSADAAASTTSVVFEPGGTFSQPTPAIPAGDSVDLKFAIPPTCYDPDCEFRIIVDSGDQITQSDVGNNIAEGTCPR
jgi:CARDB